MKGNVNSPLHSDYLKKKMKSVKRRHPELRPLEAIKDQFPKYLLTMDTIQPTANYNGIKKKNIIDWLLEK